MKDIASIAGVNISTVSKALRDSEEINRDTRERIKKIAVELGYTYRRSVTTRKFTSGPNIGIICPEVTSNYYTQILTAIDEELSRNGYFTLFSMSSFRPEIEKRLLDAYLDLGLDGIICITEGTSIQSDLSELAEKGYMPLVLIANRAAVHEFDYIAIDDRLAVEMAAEHLFDLGHRAVGYVGDRLSSERRIAFTDFWEARSRPPERGHIVEHEIRFEECGYVGLKKILDSGSLPTGLFCAYDAIAIGAMRAAHESGVRIPEDLSIVSIDDISEANYHYHRTLTTVSGPTQHMGRAAARTLMDGIEHADSHIVQHITLKPHLKVRESTAEPRSTL